MATATSDIKVQERLAPAEASQLAVTWRRFRRHRLGLIGMVALIIVVLSCIFVPIIMQSVYGLTYETIDDEALTPVLTNGNINFTKPLLWTNSQGQIHVLGTNDIGRDEFVRLFQAGRISLAVGIITTLIIVAFGGLIGAISGFYGGWVDTILMRFVDLMLAIPTLPILLIAAKMLTTSAALNQMFNKGIGSVVMIIAVLSIFGWMGVSRLVRGSILSLRSLDFVEATRALGANSRRIIMRHLLPNSFAPIIVAATLAVGDFIITESALSFLGLGIQDPTPSWGNMLNGAQGYMQFITDLNPFQEIRGYLVLFPGLMILVTVLSINFMGDAPRDALDPRLKM